MRLSDFDYHLPESLIAQQPVSPREAARLLCVSGSGRLRDQHIYDLPDLLKPGDLLVFNDTRVIPARLEARKGESVISLTLHQQIGPVLWKAFAKPGRKLKPGDVIACGDGFLAKVERKDEDGSVLLAFLCIAEDFFPLLEKHGTMPLPPYIRKGRAEAEDVASYQTLFAREKGAVAAPTAGLHFTPELMERLAARGIEHGFVTLHVGAGTFLPVKSENIAEHVMHAEYAVLPAQTAEQINQAKRDGRRVIPVGTTSLRTLEGFAEPSKPLKARQGEIRLFITPGYQFKITDALLTNFHLPKSTLLMLVSALIGRETMLAAYQHAITNNYRFFSYGDACLLEP